MIDLDNFKEINDQLGHQAGDYVISRTAQATQEILRREVILTRYGGDEFLVLSLDTDQGGIQHLADRIQSMLSNLPLNYAGDPLQVTASLGVTTLEKGTDTSLGTLIDQADQALYQSKRGGR